MLSIARSRLTLLVQFVFLVVNAFGILTGVIYNSKTPDLYPNNAHHKLGWIVTWVVSAQALMGLLHIYAGRSTKHSVAEDERAAFIPVSTEAMAEHQRSNGRQSFHDYRYSRDSGQGTERASSFGSSSPAEEHEDLQLPEIHPRYSLAIAGEDDIEEEKRGFLRNTAIDSFLSRKVPGLLSTRLWRILGFVYDVIDRIIIPFGFITLTAGIVTFAGIFRGVNVFNGLAHFIKGGIFFGYGILTLGRWMGCFADFGWAWNIKPSQAIVGHRKAAIPSAEFVESFVIFLYGTTNVFLEHLANWGGEWVPQDLEHVSISIMFFGGGLCGMLVESKKIRGLLNTSISFVAPQGSASRESPEYWRYPKSYGFSLNPLPALIIFCLGIMMGSHHQASMVSTMIHKQWGLLFAGFALARIITYSLMYLSPPTSLLPSRPPTEIIASFCLMAGGLVFMASNRDTVAAMEGYELDAMFILVVTIGLTAFLMAWQILVVAIKGLAVRREHGDTLTMHTEA
ncbi:MAG: hypothetical protein M1819_006939 [Sarea resinae]|nr:MAG: hypothetical protein M1819_006939 [Sarea resinae]